MVSIKGTSLTEREKDMDLSNGIMGRFSKEIGTMGPKTGLESGDHLKGILMKASGSTIGSMDQGDLNTKIAHMSVISKTF